MSKYKYDEKTITEKMFEFFYGYALRDATLQQAFRGEKAWIGNVKNAKEILRGYIDKLIQGTFKSEDEHDKGFFDTAERICKAINQNKPENVTDTFSFGNAQKLINITVKLFYGLCYTKTDLRNNFQYCHCPMDSIMLKRVWKEYKEQFGEKQRKENLGKGFCDSWGNEESSDDKSNTRYVKYQKAIAQLIKKDGGDIYPIEFDYYVWKASITEREVQ